MIITKEKVATGLGGVLYKMIVKDHLLHLLYIFINISPKHLIYKFFLYTITVVCAMCRLGAGLNGFLEFSIYIIQGPK